MTQHLGYFALEVLVVLGDHREAGLVVVTHVLEILLQLANGGGGVRHIPELLG